MGLYHRSRSEFISRVPFVYASCHGPSMYVLTSTQTALIHKTCQAAKGIIQPFLGSSLRQQKDFFKPSWPAKRIIRLLSWPLAPYAATLRSRFRETYYCFSLLRLAQSATGPRISIIREELVSLYGAKTRWQEDIKGCFGSAECTVQDI
jgi:hypothetical protein